MRERKRESQKERARLIDNVHLEFEHQPNLATLTLIRTLKLYKVATTANVSTHFSITVPWMMIYDKLNLIG